MLPWWAAKMQNKFSSCREQRGSRHFRSLRRAEISFDILETSDSLMHKPKVHQLFSFIWHSQIWLSLQPPFHCCVSTHGTTYQIEGYGRYLDESSQISSTSNPWKACIDSFVGTFGMAPRIGIHNVRNMSRVISIRSESPPPFPLPTSSFYQLK